MKELKDGMFVIAPKRCQSWLTEGKKYKVFNVEKINTIYKYSFHIIDDIGDKNICVLNKSGHLKDQDWIIE